MSECFRILLLDKSEDVTSFSSLGEIKREYKGEKVGHAGTLDKFASGLMIVMVGGATKLNPIFSSFDKSYRATVKFGEETDTLDREGRVIETSPVIPTLDDIKKVIPTFIGKQKQVPPVYSAVHIEGKRAYKEARKKRDIVMPERDIVIYDISIESYTPPFLTFTVSVSKGTYIRSLARDIALSLGARGHLATLRRLSIGPFTLSDLDKDTDYLLDKTELFSSIYFSSLHRKEIENGMIRKEWIERSVNPSRPYAYIYIGDELYGYGLAGDKIKIMARKAQWR